MYDITDKNSFNIVKIWMDELKKYLIHKTSQKIAIAIVGNKYLNHQRQVTTQQLHSLCNSYLQCNQHFVIDKTSWKNKSQLLCYGFVIECDTAIPFDIYRICFKFYFEIGINSILIHLRLVLKRERE